MSDTCEVGTYLLKRKLIRGGMAYEIWNEGKLILKTMHYIEFMKVAAILFINEEKKRNKSA